METDKRYFVEGLFIIGFSIAAALFAVWLADTGQARRCHLPDPFRGIGKRPVARRPGQIPRRRRRTVKTMGLDPANSQLVQVDVRLRQRHAGQDRHQGQPQAQGHHRRRLRRTQRRKLRRRKSLVAATPAGQIPEIPYEKSSLANILDQLPRVIAKFSALEDKATKVVSDVAGVTKEIKEDPTVLVAGAQGETRGGRRQAEPEARNR